MTIYTNKSCRFLIFLALMLSVSTGCAHVITSEMRQKAAKDLDFPAVLSSPEKYKGETVIFGGVIIDALNEADGSSSLKVLETPLDSYGFPGDEEYSRGRFIAKASRYLDKEIYKKGIRITLAGEIIGKEVKPLDETEYSYPVIAIKEFHLWKATPYYGGPYVYDYWYWHGYSYPYYLPVNPFFHRHF